jgi:hypothetical protein
MESHTSTVEAFQNKGESVRDMYQHALESIEEFCTRWQQGDEPKDCLEKIYDNIRWLQHEGVL